MTRQILDILCRMTRIIFGSFGFNFGIEDAIVHVSYVPSKFVHFGNNQLRHQVDIFLIFFSLYGTSPCIPNFLQICNTVETGLF